MEERRLAPRFSIARTTVGRVYAPEIELSQAACIRDLSHRGAGLLVGRPITSQNLFFVELPGRSEPQSLPARLVHSFEQSDGTWLVGCEFAVPLEDLAMREFLA